MPVRVDPFEGIGKPEPLQWDFAGAWSRRISEKHRIIYMPKANMVVVLSCREHYKDS
ncbi:Txe/YoeB family addiction module toxin [Bifidobacterium criceti]|uniref:Endoribonuclease YoeB n=1 Tax=Bifidobacterium criceti TaxID=1960969 RepID=A0A2A2EGZ2_9BIFI|nr:Txe/YoeB family addiction module toxin [Bifidobacterium criceti]PAU68271.1 addiction module toxin, Txe/YoeB family [Bifidobacterium criceti]